MKGELGFAPDPAAGVCEAFVRVRFHEIDALGHVNNAAYLNYLEQAAIDHATVLGFTLERLRELGGVFVARRHDVVYLRPAYAGDLLRIVTWLEEPRGARVNRRYVVSREPETTASVPIGGRLVGIEAALDERERVVQAVTEWVFATERGQPSRIPSDIAHAFRPGAS